MADLAEGRGWVEYGDGGVSAPGWLATVAVRLICAGWVPHDRVFGGGGALSRIERGPVQGCS